MNAGPRDWCDRAWSTVSSLPGTIGKDLRARWDDHAKRDELVVTLFGPYDSGKSSLLKRLLVDDRRPIPDWLTVSGRRETFETREAAVLGVVVRDTPGIAGGNEQHERAADEALLLTDAIALVLPPQLVTSNRDSIVAVLNGTRFSCPASVVYGSRGVVVVLSRMDEAGAMPRDDEAGYRALVRRKREEFGDLLKSENVNEETVAVHAIAADPFGLVGNAVPSGPQEYDADRGWDGLGELAASLRGLTARKTEFRLRSEIRFLGAELTALASSLEAMASETRIAAEAASNEAMSYGLVQDRLRAVLRAARADLDRRIEEEVSTAARRGAADINELREAILGRIEAALDRWTNQHDSALQALVREADTEMGVRRTRPAWGKLREVLGGEGLSPKRDPGESGRKGPRATFDKVQRLTKILHKGFREAQPLTLGMPLDKARTELQRLQGVGSFEEYAKQVSRGSNRLRDAAHVAQARRALLIDAGFEVALPVLLELGGLLGELVVEHKAVQQRAKHREETRRVVEEASKKLALSAWSIWCHEGTPGAIEHALHEAQAAAERTAAALATETQTISSALAEVRERLDALQTMSTGKC
jgi:hypothetical protein